MSRIGLLAYLDDNPRIAKVSKTGTLKNIVKSLFSQVRVASDAVRARK